MDKLSTKYSASEILHLIRTKKDAFWSRERERRPLQLFHEAARRVPAYKDFLKKNKVNPAKIKTFQDFQLVPPVSKKNYLRQYPLEKLVWDGTLAKPLVWTSTSGSTGEPAYFPRGNQLDWEASIVHDLFLQNSSHGSNGPILVIVGFGMGAWVGGLITYKAFEITGRRVSDLSIITPGINKPEIFHALRKLAPHFKQTILSGYPPFVKDIIDEAKNEGVNLKKLHLRILTAAEAYSELFREYIVEKAGVKSLYLDVLNIYGTADIGAMAFETPTSILIRRLAMKNAALFRDLFTPIEKTPTLAQYNPLFITFEAQHDEILLSGYNTIPLIRYAVGDHGGVLNFQEAVAKCKHYHFDLLREGRRVGVQDLYELPFVYVYERHDFSAKLYGAIIYPEHVRDALHAKKLHRFVTGKFTMLTKFDREQNQYLEIHIELKPKIKVTPRLETIVKRLILSSLLKKNAEFRNNYSFIPNKVTPHLTFWSYEHESHFKPGIKQKWVKK